MFRIKYLLFVYILSRICLIYMSIFFIMFFICFGAKPKCPRPNSHTHLQAFSRRLLAHLHAEPHLYEQPINLFPTCIVLASHLHADIATLSPKLGYSLHHTRLKCHTHYLPSPLPHANIPSTSHHQAPYTHLHKHHLPFNARTIVPWQGP